MWKLLFAALLGVLLPGDGEKSNVAEAQTPGVPGTAGSATFGKLQPNRCV